VSDGVNSFVYDATGRMSSAAGAGGSAAYQISALGQRVMKQLQEATTVFHYDREGRILAESDAAGTVMREYLWLDGMPIAYFDGTSLYYVHTDHLGTPRLLAGGTGAPVWRWEGPPFGEGAADEDPDGNGVQVSYNLRFPGQYRDKETGLHYNYFRDYDPSTGRYIQSDPIGLVGGLNLYTYVEGNPISRVDPLGLKGGCPPGMAPDENHICRPTPYEDPNAHVCVNTECLTYNANLDPNAKILYCEGGRLKMCGPAVVNVAADLKKCDLRKAPWGSDCRRFYSSCIDLGSCISDACEKR